GWRVAGRGARRGAGRGAELGSCRWLVHGATAPVGCLGAAFEDSQGVLVEEAAAAAAAPEFRG
ncbi:hypothetical protein V502_02004, partial [Pseudogymnoascus sp. VKM F-4520 (FW-2644)]